MFENVIEVIENVRHKEEEYFESIQEENIREKIIEEQK